MKVLHINTSLEGSIGNIIKDIHHNLVLKYGEESSLIAIGKYKLGSHGFDKSEIIYFSNKFVNLFLRFQYFLFGNENNIATNICTNNLIKYIIKFKPDIIHVHNLHGYYINLNKILLFFEKYQTKYLFTLHDEFLYTGKCCYTYNCDKWKTYCFECPSLKDYPKTLKDNTYNNYIFKIDVLNRLKNITIITPSKWLYKRLLNSNLNNIQSNIIYNGINTNLFYPRDKNYVLNKFNIENKKIILSIANGLFDGRKGGEFVLDLATKFASLNNIIFIIISNDSSKIANKYSNIITIDYIADQNILSFYYSAADVFLITSKSDNLPTVCLESLACGTPVVGFNTGGIAEIVYDDIGELVPYGNTILLKNAIFNILNKPINYQFICRDFILKNFMNQQMVDSYLKIYQS